MNPYGFHRHLKRHLDMEELVSSELGAFFMKKAQVFDGAIGSRQLSLIFAMNDRETISMINKRR